MGPLVATDSEYAAPINDWPLTSQNEKLNKIGAKLVSHVRNLAFLMAEAAIPRNLFAGTLTVDRGIAAAKGPFNGIRR